MANGPWYTSSGPGDANITVGARSLQLALAGEVKNAAIMGHPVIRELMSRDRLMGELMGALGVSVGLITAGTSKMAATAEGTAATATDWATANSATVSPARLAHARSLGDFGIAIQEGLLDGQIGPTAMALVSFDAIGAYVNKLVDLLVATATSATYTIGTSGASLSWAALQDGVIDMKNRGVTGPGLALLTAGQVKALTQDMLGLGGAMQWASQAQEGIQTLGRGAYIGRFNEIDVYMNGELDTSGGDDYGVIFTPGSHKVEHKRVPLGYGAQVIEDLGFLTMEARRPGGGVSLVESVVHLGVGIQEQVRYAAIVSKTP